ncbi:FAD dependent oxidoreductase [Exidia glandulosa HHB12029]|uniref:FAD dependent oxidoreductase n=1 Tax=Exidia glandulosa HHB12029 TaxID=1314781 RepID=A0A165HZE4_EXIGL|nr:FAD dependent oxidoreductase [Exidia glandulosa HHB12029]
MNPSADSSTRQPTATTDDWPAGLPIRDPCISFWMASTRGFEHLTENSTGPLPERADTVVIGSGLAGSLAAWHLLENGAKDIVMLEARDACSCASARNGGHVRPDPFYGFPSYAEMHGEEQARKIIENERVVLREVEEFVEKYRVDCDFEALSTFHTALNDAHLAELKAGFEQYKSSGAAVDHIKFLDGEDAVKATRVPLAKGAVEYTAASVHPAKLCQFLISSNIKNGLQLFTHAPALRVESAADGHWAITTPRGTVIARRVLHATNAFASHLLPELKGCIIPNKSQCHALVPSRAYAGSNRLKTTQAYAHSESHYWYSMQRKTDGIIVLGIGRFNPELDEETRRLIIEERALDRRALPGMTTAAVQAFHELHPDFGVEEMLSPGEGLQMAWSGVIASTVEGVPFIGEVPGKPGQWICTGWSGHGMSRIWTGAPAVATLMSGGSWADTGLPECFELTAERLARSQGIAKNI